MPNVKSKLVVNDFMITRKCPGGQDWTKSTPRVRNKAVKEVKVNVLSVKVLRSYYTTHCFTCVFDFLLLILLILLHFGV